MSFPWFGKGFVTSIYTVLLPIWVCCSNFEFLPHFSHLRSLCTIYGILQNRFLAVWKRVMNLRRVPNTRWQKSSFHFQKWIRQLQTLRGTPAFSFWVHYSVFSVLRRKGGSGRGSPYKLIYLCFLFFFLCMLCQDPSQWSWAPWRCLWYTSLCVSSALPDAPWGRSCSFSVSSRTKMQDTLFEYTSIYRRLFKPRWRKVFVFFKQPHWLSQWTVQLSTPGWDPLTDGARCWFLTLKRRRSLKKMAFDFWM